MEKKLKKRKWDYWERKKQISFHV